jgi:hypothetical protein
MSEVKKKPDVLKRATAHYQSQLKEMKSYYVEEWDTTIYFRNTSSLAQEAEVVELTRANKSIEALVVSIINKARFEDGSLMFNKHDKSTLMKEADPNVVLKLSSVLNGGDIPVGEIEKN